MHHVFEHFHIQIWQEIGESDLLLQTMRSEDWCYVSSFRAAPVLVVFCSPQAEELKAAALKAKEDCPQQARVFFF